MFDVFVQKSQGAFFVNAAFESRMTGVTALFGESGAGKTSVVNMIAGLSRPDHGHITVNERRLFDSDRQIHVAPEKRRIGYVFQDGRLFPHLSVLKNLSLGLHRTPKHSRYIDFDTVVDLLGLGPLLTRYPLDLSGGEKQRVAIGRALLTSPLLLLMDEPLASLDKSRKNDVLPFISRLSSRFSIPILYVSHALDEILQLAHHVVLMDRGGVAASGDTETMMNRADLQPFFGGREYGAVISSVVDVARDSYGLTRLRFAGGMLTVPPLAATEGMAVRVRVPARGVSIALEKPGQTSIRNIFQGTVAAISSVTPGLLSGSDAFVDVHMDIGAPLVARITKLSRESLELRPGKPVFAQIKTISVLNGGLE